MEREQGRGEQYDPAEIAIAELQGPVDADRVAAIRRMYWGEEPTILQNQRPGEGNNDRFPEVVGKTERSGWVAAIEAEALDHAAIEPGASRIEVSNSGSFSPADPELEKGIDWV